MASNSPKAGIISLTGVVHSGLSAPNAKRAKRPGSTDMSRATKHSGKSDYFRAALAYENNLNRLYGKGLQPQINYRPRPHMLADAINATALIAHLRSFDR